MKLELFGGPTLWRDGSSVRLSPFQAGLLAIAFSAATARVPRSKIRRLLWDSPDNPAVRHRLSQLVYQTNHRCGAKVLVLDGEHIRIRHGFVACDLSNFAEMVRTGHLGEACDLLERGFLSAIPQKKSEPFSDWIEEKRISLRARLRETSVASWEAAEAVRDWVHALQAAEVLLRLDPQDESVLRRVMRARATGGMVREAEAVYRSFAERAEPLGHWTPEVETRKLLQTVKGAYRRSVELPGDPAHQRTDSPFCGRADELARLTANVYRQRPGGPWGTITVSGEAGVGKTRLIEEAIQGARFRGYRVMHACSAELERDITLSPLLEGLDQPWLVPILHVLADPWRHVLLSLLPQFAEADKPLPDIRYAHSGNLERYTCEAFLNLFVAIAKSQKTLLFLDDFHWADDTTAAVVRFLHKRSRGGKFTLLLAYRHEELRGSGLVARFIHELEADSEVAAIRLGALDGPSAKNLVRGMAPQDPPDAAVSEIVALGGGNPRFLIELAANSRTDGTPWRHGKSFLVPPSVRQVIGRRMNELDTDARKVISGLAVFGQTATLGHLTRMTGCSRNECVDAVEQLQRESLVEWVDDGVRTRYDIIRHAVYEDLSPGRRSMLHRLTAEVLRSDSNEPPFDRIARHYYRAGSRELAHIYAAQAVRGTDSAGVIDHLSLLNDAYMISEGFNRSYVAAPLARAYYQLRQLDTALRFCNETLRYTAEISSSDFNGVRLILADIRHLLGLDESASTLAKLAYLEGAARDADRESRLAEVLDTTLQVLDRSGDRSGVASLLARIAEMEPLRDPGARCRILGSLAMEALYGDPEAGLVCARRAVEEAQAEGQRTEMTLALHRYIVALLTNGLLASEEGRSALDMARAASREIGDPTSRARILLTIAEWHTTTGSYAIAAKVFEEAGTVTAAMDCPQIQSLATLSRGNLALAQGDLAAAHAALSGGRGRVMVPGSVEEIEVVAVPPNLVDPLASLAGKLLLESGKLYQAARLAKHHPLHESLGDAPVDLILFHARLRSRKGDGAGALTLLERGVAENGPRRPIRWLRLVLELVRLARRSGSPRPQLAERARDKASELGLSEMAHEFVPFTD